MKKPAARTYTMMHELMASPIDPIPEAKARHQLLRMHQGLEAMEKGSEPTSDDWRMLSDAVNLMETLLDMGEVEDVDKLTFQALTALAEAGKRAVAGKPLRLDGPGIQAVRALLEDYATCLKVMPERTIIRCHRKTEARLRDILAGKRKPHDVEVIEADFGQKGK